MNHRIDHRAALVDEQDDVPGIDVAPAATDEDRRLDVEFLALWMPATQVGDESAFEIGECCLIYT
jgi:hypothetical protein